MYLCSCTTGSILAFTSLMGDGFNRSRPVFYRERAAGYYRPEAFSVMLGFTELPFLLISSIIFNCESMMHGESSVAYCRA